MRKSVWAHLLALAAASVVYVVAIPVFASYGRGTNATLAVRVVDAVLWAPAQFTLIIPIIVAIAVGGTALTTLRLRHAVAICIIATVSLIAIDEFLEPEVPRLRVDAARYFKSAWTHPADSAAPMITSSGTGSLRAGLNLLIRPVAGIQDVHQGAYSSTHPRVIAVDAVASFGALLLPFVVVGIVLGASAWIGRHATFAVPRDEAVMRWVTAWVLAPVVTYTVSGWSLGSRYSVLFLGHAIWKPLLPYVLFTWLASQGWRTAVGVLKGTAQPQSPVESG